MDKRRLLTTGVVLLCELALVVYLIPGDIVWICLIIGGAAASYFLFMARKARKERLEEPSTQISILPLLSVILPFLFGWLTWQLGYLSVPTAILATSLTIEFFSNFLALPLSIYHKHLEIKLKEKEVKFWPLVTLIVPAHNEERIIERCIEALLEVDYPKKEIIVVDDGSTDGTYNLASQYREEGVRVFRRSQCGGKPAALNTGILFSKGEIIVTCDADSLISRTALRMIVKRFADPEVSAVAGNVKVLNRTNLVTKCQALEYVVNQNIYRRVFDIFGVVPVVPGPLAAFRKSSLEEIGLYDRDTLTEDFDVTIKVLKTGEVVQALSDAHVYTEAPSSWTSLIRQRIRWNRGTFQNLIKHKDVFGNPRFGFVRNLAIPYVLLSMVFIPVASLVSLTSIIFAFLTGFGLQVLSVMGGFFLIQATYSYLAVQMDDEDPNLIVLSPLFVLGYKDLRNLIKIKALIDVLTKRKMKWGTIERTGKQHI